MFYLPTAYCLLPTFLLLTSPRPPAAFALAHLFLHPLELFGREHLPQALVGLPADVFHARLGVPAGFAELLARVGEDLLHLRPLLAGQLKAVEHLLEPAAPPVAAGG